jgi:agmatinase
MSIEKFDPSGVGLKNGNFIGLPFKKSNANLVLFPVPWDVTVSSGDGTATGPLNILEQSSQLDLLDEDVPDAWKLGIYFQPVDNKWLRKGQKLRPKATELIHFLEDGGKMENSVSMRKIQTEINTACEDLRQWVHDETSLLLDQDKAVVLVGGDHSTPLGYVQALSERNKSFGILHFDAHLDQRKAYEGFTYSHASIFHNISEIPQVKQIVSVGIRDYCDEELMRLKQLDGRHKMMTARKINDLLLEGSNFKKITKKIIKPLPEKVYISFDIDVLEPHLCPNTGTPVPGGLSYAQAIYILSALVKSGRKIIGADLNEVAGQGNPWDGTVGARILYKLCNLLGKSRGLI